MRPIGTTRPNSGTTARMSDLAGEATEDRLKAPHKGGSGKAAINREASPGAAYRHVPVGREGAGRLARAKD
jgi:hypothetical protein